MQETTQIEVPVECLENVNILLTSALIYGGDKIYIAVILHPSQLVLYFFFLAFLA